MKIRTASKPDRISPKIKNIPYIYDLYGLISLLAIFVLSQIYSAPQNPVLKLTGIIFLIVACILWILGLIQLKKYGRIMPGDQYYMTTTLIDQGIFSVIRHPQYLAYILLAAGFVLISQHIAVICAGVIAMACFYLQTLREEKFLRDGFPDDYELYSRRVDRFNLISGLIRHFKKSR